MKKKNKKRLVSGASLVVAFVLWTVFVCFVDVRPIGPEGSSVGFATLNGLVHEFTGVNWLLYTVTDWLGLVPITVAFGFAVLGLVQLIKRKSLWKVDRSILALGVFYIVVMAAYVLFEMVVINYRPTLIDGYLEASYPSSTTILVMCVMPTAAMQLNVRIKNTVLRRYTIIAIIAFTAFMVIGRSISGVHWITDIIGGALLSTGLLMIYYSVSNIVTKNC
jgi:undecaprenyl-diphosphatase